MIRPEDWPSHYADGDRQLVWHELRQFGDRVREPGVEPYARAVCGQMAHRARGNVELIVRRLADQGFRFHDNTDDEAPLVPHVPPGPDVETYLRHLEERYGAIPLTLAAWLRIVGDVCLMGTHPDWPDSVAADPLVIEAEGTRYGGLLSLVDDEWNAWEEDPLGHPFALPVAPDRLHKANISGGGPYGFFLPDACADATLDLDGTPVPFVSYLNHVFSRGGFPYPTGDPAGRRVCRELARDLQPL